MVNSVNDPSCKNLAELRSKTYQKSFSVLAKTFQKACRCLAKVPKNYRGKEKLPAPKGVERNKRFIYKTKKTPPRLGRASFFKAETFKHKINQQPAAKQET
jgi:hypothetical protein